MGTLEEHNSAAKTVSLVMAVTLAGKALGLYRDRLLAIHYPLCNSLCTSFGSRLGKEGVAAAIERCGLAPSIRGEALDMARFAALADSLWEALGNP